MTASTTRRSLPADGVTWDVLETEMRARRLDDIRGHWTKAFRAPRDVQEVGLKAYTMFLSDNGFFSLYHPYIGDIEQETLEMCVSLFHPLADSCGNTTSGGSESIFCALHAAREWAREHRPVKGVPEIVLPYSAHPAFSKACHYLGMKIVRTALAADYRGDVQAMADAVGPNTIALVGSAPCWPYGLYDRLEDISALAVQHGLWMHVDACVGGYLAPFVERLGHALPAWDFRLPGVQSISADLHKLGYCPKPMSTVLWRSAGLQKFHYVSPVDWPAGEYKMMGLVGSRSGGPVFAAWCTLKYLGDSGYLRLAGQVLDAKRRLVDGIRAIEGLDAWDTDLLPVAFGSKGDDLEAIVGGMTALGWVLLGNYEPPLVNLPVDAATDDAVIDTFLDELADVTGKVHRGEIDAKGELRYG
ncbi:MAG: aspartate aminotransferase family protein [Gammaproteobacteria bacterium]|nr:aspartate aminotransferase family protein [Gammaproteobacteria bacterium]